MSEEETEPRDNELKGTRMTFGEHLEELRTRLLRALKWSILGLVVVFIFHEDVLEVVVAPYRRVMEDLHLDPSLKATAPTQPFFTYVKVSFIVGLILTAPMWIYQLWAFVGAGLYRREKRLVFRYAPLCLGLFAGGVVFGYFLLIPVGLEYLLTFADPTVMQAWIVVGEYLRLFTVLTLLLGIAFQLPVIMLGLTRAGMTTTEGLRNKRKYAIVGIFVLGALLTPPDPVTQLLMALPLVGLYETGIWLAWLGMGSGRTPLRWPLIRRRAAWFTAVALVIFLFRGHIWDLAMAHKVDKRLYEPSATEHPPLDQLASRLLGEPVDGVMVLPVDEPPGSSLVAVLAGHGARVLRLEPRRRTYQVLDREEGGRGLVFDHYRQERPLWRLRLPERVPYQAFVPQLLECLRYGSEKQVQVARSLLARLTGRDPQGGPEEVLKAFRAWFAEHAGEAAVQ